MTVDRLLALFVCSAALSAAHAQVPQALTGGKKVKFRDASGAGRDLAKVIFTRDPGALHARRSHLRDLAGRRIAALLDRPADQPVGPAALRELEPGGRGLPLLGPVRRQRRRAEGPLQARQADHQGEGRCLRPCPPRSGELRRGALQGRDAIPVRALHDLQEEHAPNRSAAGGPSTACQEECGDGISEGSEACDDGNAVNGNGCDTNCTLTGCGNGIQTAGEALRRRQPRRRRRLRRQLHGDRLRQRHPERQRAVRRRQPRQRRRLRQQLHADRLRQRRADRRRELRRRQPRPTATAAAPTARRSSAATASSIRASSATTATSLDGDCCSARVRATRTASPARTSTSAPPATCASTAPASPRRSRRGSTSSTTTTSAPAATPRTATSSSRSPARRAPT